MQYCAKITITTIPLKKRKAGITTMIGLGRGGPTGVWADLVDVAGGNLLGNIIYMGRC